jgi:glycosyltransferase involved in cell wall biosynthesis
MYRCVSDECGYSRVTDILVLAAAGPGERDGIGDYSWHLAQALAARDRHCRATLVIGRASGSDRTASAAPAVSNGDGRTGIERLASWHELRSPEWHARGEQADGVLLQYFPQAFVARDFPALAGWLGARRRRGRPIVVTLHEYWPHASLSPRREVMRWRSRRALRQLVDVGTAFVVSQPFSVGELTGSGIVPPRALHVIPVGSAIPRVETADRVIPARQVLAIFGQPAMVDARAVRAIAGWLGRASNPPHVSWFSRSEVELRSWWSKHIGPQSPLVTFHGGLPARELSQCFETATLGLALYSDGASTRRSSLAALVEHRLPIAGLDGRYTDDRIRASGAFDLVPQHAPDALPGTIAALLADGARQARMSAAAEQLFARDLSWPGIASAYDALEAGR